MQNTFEVQDKVEVQLQSNKIILDIIKVKQFEVTVFIEHSFMIWNIAVFLTKIKLKGWSLFLVSQLL